MLTALLDVAGLAVLDQLIAELADRRGQRQPVTWIAKASNTAGWS
jgi:hypothetical protein